MRPAAPPPTVLDRSARAAIAVSHVADFNRRYPGEPVTFFTRVEVLAPVPGFSLRISLPRQMVLAGTTASGNQGEASVLLVVGDDQFLRWSVIGQVVPGDRFEYQVSATIGQLRQDRVLESEAVVITEPPGAGEQAIAETAAVSVESQGAYIRFLPGIYAEQDEFMARYLMLFESFWAPIEQQIEAIPHYVDPEFTPTQLLPWLATWVDLTLDERWPEEKRRRLLASAVGLYRKRGTRLGCRSTWKSIPAPRCASPSTGRTTSAWARMRAWGRGWRWAPSTSRTPSPLRPTCRPSPVRPRWRRKNAPAWKPSGSACSKRLSKPKNRRTPATPCGSKRSKSARRTRPRPPKRPRPARYPA